MKRNDVKDISVTCRFNGENWWRLAIVHRKNLLLEEFNVTRHYDINFIITYSKPWADKYVGLVLEYLLNTNKDVHKITVLQT